jgi:O-antigen/teichoic acid export membrane protein
MRRQPERAGSILATMLRTKAVLFPAAVVVLAAIVVGMRYPQEIVWAGLAGGISLLFSAGIQVFRVVFKATLSMEREVAAELISVLAFIPLVWLAARGELGLIGLMACHAFSRLLFFVCCAALGWRHWMPERSADSWQKVGPSLAAAAAIGASGLLVVVYETVDILLLSRLSTSTDLAGYSAAQRLSSPMLMALYAVGATLYPLAASYWPSARESFQEACQRAFDTVLLLGGAAAAVLVAGAEGLLRLIGPELTAAVPAVRLLALLCIMKGISATIGPMLYLANGQKYGLYLFVAVLAVKTTVIALVAPRYGVTGVAIAVVVVETFCGVIPTLELVRRWTGLRLRWTMAGKVALIALVAAAAPLAAGVGPFAAMALTAALFFVLAIVTRSFKPAEVLMMLKARTA